MSGALVASVAVTALDSKAGIAGGDSTSASFDVGGVTWGGSKAVATAANVAGSTDGVGNSGIAMTGEAAEPVAESTAGNSDSAIVMEVGADVTANPPGKTRGLRPARSLSKRCAAEYVRRYPAA